MSLPFKEPRGSWSTTSASSPNIPQDSFSRPFRSRTQDSAPGDSPLHSAFTFQDFTSDKQPAQPGDTAPDAPSSSPQRASLTSAHPKSVKPTSIPSPTWPKPNSPRRVKGTTGNREFDYIKAAASRHAILERAGSVRASEDKSSRGSGSSVDFNAPMAESLPSPRLQKTGSTSVHPRSSSLRTIGLDPAASLVQSPSLRALSSEDPNTIDIPTLIAAAGSPEDAIRKLLREKHAAAQTNTQLWRLLDKQGAVLADLNKELGKITKEKDRYKRKLKEHLHSTTSLGHSLSVSSAHSAFHRRDGSESPSVVSPLDGAATPDSAVGSLTSERFIDDYLSQTPPSSAGQLAPSPHSHSSTSPMYAKPMAAPFAEPAHAKSATSLHDATIDTSPQTNDGRTSVSPRPKQGSFTATVRERSSSAAARKGPPAPLDLSPQKSPFAEDYDCEKSSLPMLPSSGMIQQRSSPARSPTVPNSGGLPRETTWPDNVVGTSQITSSPDSFSSGSEFSSPHIAQVQTYQSLNALNTFVKSPHKTSYDSDVRASPAKPTLITSGLPVSPRPVNRPTVPVGPRSPAAVSSSPKKEAYPSLFPQPPPKDAETSLRTVRYDSTVAAEAPTMGQTSKSANLPPMQPPPPPPVPASPAAETPTESSSARPPQYHPVISGPTNGAVIQDASTWGNRKEPKLLTKDRPKRSDSEKKEYQVQPPRDRKRSLFGISGRSSMEAASRENSGSTAADKHKPVFGMPLADVVEYGCPTDVPVAVPAVVYRCLEYLRGMDAKSEEGIFRMSGSSVVIKALRERFDTEGDVRLLSPGAPMHDVHAVASLLKLYLRELPVTILTNSLHMDFVNCTEFPDKNNMIDGLNIMVNRLPAPNRELLDKMTAYLHEIVENDGVNKMNIRNVAIVFSPTLNISVKLITALVTEHAKIFGPPRDIDSVDSSVAALLSKPPPRAPSAMSFGSIEEALHREGRSQSSGTLQSMQFPEPPLTARFPPGNYYDSKYSSPRSPGTMASPNISSATTLAHSQTNSPAKSGRTSIFRKKASMINLNDINISFSPFMGSTSPEMTRGNTTNSPRASHGPLMNSMSADHITSPSSPAIPAMNTSQSGPVGPIPSTKYADMHSNTSPQLGGSKSRSASAQSASSGSDSGSSFGRRLLRRQSGAFLVRAGLVEDRSRAKMPPPVDVSKGFVPGGLGLTSPTGQPLGVDTPRRAFGRGG